MHTLLTNFKGINNLGLFGFVNDKIGLVGTEVPKKVMEEFEEVFDVPFHKITIAGTSLIGAFTVALHDKILIPSITFEHEKQKLKEIGIEYEVFESNLTCLGNNIVISNKGLLVNPEFNEKEINKLKELYDRKVVAKNFASTNAVGNIVVVNNDVQKGLVSNDITEQEFDEIKEILEIDLTPGSVNLGSPYVKTGILVNKNGFAIGSVSGGPEITNAEQGLGFVEY